MELHIVTFQRLEEMGMGSIRSVDVDHSRRRLVVICDPPSAAEVMESATIPQIGFHGAHGSTVQRDNKA